MNASEIEYIEARLQAGLTTMPSPEQVDRLVARVQVERSRYMAAAFVNGVEKIIDFVVTVREIAAACTAARLHARNI